MDDKVAIQVKNVSKNFALPHEKVDSVKSIFVNPFQSRSNLKTETQHALKNIDFEVKKGEFFGIVGRNGSGKSTLLKIIANIYKPTAGNVTVNGRLVPFIELGVGFNPELTGRENTYLNGALMGFSSEEVDDKYKQIVEFSELERFMDQKLKNYSSGMQVRLAFSVATILADSDILLIDEVLAVGDADFQRKCFSFFKHLKKEGKTVIFVTHDMSAVREYCDRAVLIDDTQLRAEGSAEHIAEEYTKLFNMNKEFETNKTRDSVERWGDGAATIDKVDIKKTKHAINLDIHAIARDNLEDPIVGFSIKDATGKAIFGTNNRLIQQKIDNLFAGNKRLFKWEIPNIFSSGEYTIDIAISHSDGITQADWWNDAVTFEVINKFSSPHPISPPVSFTVD